MSARLKVLLLVIVCGGVLIALSFIPRAPQPQAEPPPAARPKLAVVIVVDQLRADYLTRWPDQFGAGGFRRLSNGTWFENCRYPYAFVETGPGHATIATGCVPAEHGIVMNDWFDTAVGDVVYCVDGPAPDRYRQIPPPAPTDKPAKKKSGGMSPERLLVPTLADALKADGGRVFSVSSKDRSAVLMGGRTPDACYWFDTASGTAVTSNYYRDGLHPWAEAFNRRRSADQWSGKVWDRLRPDLDYARLVGPDDVDGEGTGFGQGRTFPHPMGTGPKYFDSLYNSPFGNELLLEFTLDLIDAERPGGGERPDLLCVSFSSTDVVGHCWGPDSQEVFDGLLRVDEMIARLLTRLDERIGRDRYVVALTADHGVCPLPEVSRAAGRDAGRVVPKDLAADADQFLADKFGAGAGGWVKGRATPWLYLNRGRIQRSGADPATVEGALTEWVKRRPGVLAAYSRTELTQGALAGDEVAASVRRSFQPDRCGDVAVVVKPYYLLTPYLTGTGHGTPHDYDTHVPLLVAGTGIPQRISQEQVTPLVIAPILARALGIPPPAHATASVPEW